MKLKPIPTNTVVHTPTEAEAKELLAILHENGHEWMSGDYLLEQTNWNIFEQNTCYQIQPSKRLLSCGLDFAHQINSVILTLAEFKERYVEEESHNLSQNSTNCDKSEELNLCELLKGHEGEEFFSLTYGRVKLDKIKCHPCAGFNDFLIFGPAIWEQGVIIIRKNGTYKNAALVDIFPSCALYKQYPLDPYTAWMKWREEQKSDLHISWYSQTSPSVYNYNQRIDFHATAARDKCIEEIKAIIEKYSK